MEKSGQQSTTAGHGHRASRNTTPSDPNPSQDRNLYYRSGKRFDPNWYCSYHGYKVEELHTSSTWSFTSNGHKKSATQLNIMVGETWNMERINGGPIEWGGAGLDKDMVNMNENYINYIQSNPKLVLQMYDIELADTGRTGNYLTLDSPCINKQKAVHSIPFQMPNGKVIKSTHTELLDHPDLPLQARQAHLSPGLTKALLSIGKLCNHGCEATFIDNPVRIKNKQSGKIIMRVKRDVCKNLYMLSVTQQKKLMTESTTPDEYFAGSAYKCKSKCTLVDYHHASCWSPTHSGWGKAITKNFFTSWPGLSLDVVHKHLTKKQSTILGHLQQPRKGLRPTKEKVMHSKPDP